MMGMWLRPAELDGSFSGFVSASPAQETRRMFEVASPGYVQTEESA